MILLGSVREGRLGLPIAEWVRRSAEAYGGFDIDFADLAEIALPFMDEPNHPRLGQYTKPHTIAWSERVARADAFVFVFPEYNYSYGPVIKNALDYLFAEWRDKPVGFVNWGGKSGGTRAQTALRPVAAALGLVATKTCVELSFAHRQLEDGVFIADDQQQKAMDSQLAELQQLDAVLKPLR